jgi:hypothetical protein
MQNQPNEKPPAKPKEYFLHGKVFSINREKKEGTFGFGEADSVTVVWRVDDSTRFEKKKDKEYVPSSFDQLKVDDRVSVSARFGVLSQSFPAQGTAETVRIEDQ